METGMFAKRLVEAELVTLSVGSHQKGLSEGACVMELASYVAGESWSDSPECVSPVIAAFMRSYNDSVDDKVRQSLKAYLLRLLGTRASPELEERRALIAADWLVRTHTPAWLRLTGLHLQADALSSLPEITSMAQCPSLMPALNAARAAARAAARDAARGAAGDASGDASGDAARAAARDAARAAAGDAARDAARAAAGDAAQAAAWDAARDAARAAAWDAARGAAGAASEDAAWVAAWAAARVAAWDAAGDAARVAAWAAAGDAAWAALKPTVEALQATVPALIERMLEAQ